MTEMAVTVREATPADRDRVLEWRNHPAVASMSSDPTPIDPSVHAAWFPRVLADPGCALLIGELAGTPVGVVRFDCRADRAAVSIYLAPERIGSGLGAPLLRAAEGWLAGRHREVRRLTATVLPSNPRSQRMFEIVGYVRSADGYAKDLEPA